MWKTETKYSKIFKERCVECEDWKVDHLPHPHIPVVYDLQNIA